MKIFYRCLLIITLFSANFASAGRELDPDIYGTWKRVGLQTSLRYIPSKDISVFSIGNDWIYRKVEARSLKPSFTSGRIRPEKDGQIFMLTDDGSLTTLGWLSVENGFLICRPEEGAPIALIYERVSDEPIAAPMETRMAPDAVLPDNDSDATRDPDRRNPYRPKFTFPMLPYSEPE